MSDTKLDLSIYPDSWSSYIGQEVAKRQLQLAIKSAKARKAPLEHLFLSAPPGVGKTALALLVAREMTKGRPSSQWKFVSDQVSIVQAYVLLNDMRDGDVLIIDEFHKMVDGGKRKAEWLLHYLQDGVLVDHRGATADVPKVTIIAATTEPERIPEAILSRFPMRPPLAPYSQGEASRIAGLMAKGLLNPLGKPAPSRANCDVIASASGGNPRAIRRLLITLRDLVVAADLTYRGSPPVGYDMAEVLAMHDVTADGLDATARRYLELLVTEFDGKAGAKVLSSRLGARLDDVENILLEKGLVMRSATGREITPAGIKRHLALVAEREEKAA